MPEDKKLIDASGVDQNKEDETATAILRRKKKDNGKFISCHSMAFKPLITNSLL